MKFLLLALTVLGVAQANVIQPKSIEQAFNDIKAIIPTDKIIEIVQACADDPQIQQIAEFLRTDFHVVVEAVRADEEIAGFFQFLHENNVEFTILNHLFELWGIPPIEFDRLPKADCGGWRGTWEQVQEEFDVYSLIVAFSQAADTYPDFADLLVRISEAQPTIERLRAHPDVAAVFERMEALGFNRPLFIDFINGLFGWTLS